MKRRRQRCLIGLFAVLVLLRGAVLADPGALERHVEFIASGDLAGRLTGTPGEQKAVEYIVRELERIGAAPLPGRKNLILPFEFTAGMNDAGSGLSLQSAADGKPLKWSGTEQIQALSFSDNGRVSGPVVFAGYGLSVPDGDDFEYDSFHGLDLEGKIALVLRYFPEDVDQQARMQLARHSGLRYKALHARELGAKAVLVVAGPRSPNAGETIPMTFDTALSGSGIVAGSISGEIAQRIFSSVEGQTLEAVQELLDSGNPHITGFDIPGLTLTLDIEVERESKIGRSVAGVIYGKQGSTPAAGEPEYVVLGAHLDHLGRGKHGNSLADKSEAEEIHFGADDNASGVAAVLEAGRLLAGKKLQRPVVLAFWSGEELGLLGSSAFVKTEVVPAGRIAAYLNFDMVGRMRENRLTLQSAGSSSVWPRLIERANVALGFDINLQDDPYLPTDSTSFYQAGVPSLNFFTGSHENYHRPGDLPSTINYEDLERVARFAANVAGKLSRLSESPDYLKVSPRRESRGDRDTLRAFTGTIPDYTTETEGLRLSGVIGGGPADVAGLREGDVIVKLAGIEVKNIYDYTYALDAVKIDEPVQVVFLRDDEQKEVTIVPTTRK